MLVQYLLYSYSYLVIKSTLITGFLPFFLIIQNNIFECLRNTVCFLVFVYFSSNICCWLILDCYIEDDGAMKSNAFFGLKENRVLVNYGA